MGQYYKAYVKRPNQRPKIIDPWAYENGAKLTEHSWLGNRFANAVVSYIENQPAQVAWVGDYSTERDNNGNVCEDNVFRTCWSDDTYAYKINIYDQNLFKKGDETIGEGFLVNHTKKQVIDMTKYVSLAKDRDGWSINPLCLITAVGNGLGGGDYRGMNMEMVGYWTMDVIEFSRGSKPKTCTDITNDVIFKEE